MPSAFSAVDVRAKAAKVCFMELLIICPLVFLAGFIDAIAGGGGLISLPAFLIAGIAPHQALGTNKLSSCIGTFFSTARYVKKGFVIWRYAIPSVVTAFLGSFLGSNLALTVSETALQWFMLFAIPCVGVYLLTKKDLGQVRDDAFSQRKTTLICAGIAFVVGLYDGFYGPGTGTFLLLALTSIGRVQLDNAAGITKVINLTTNFAAAVVFAVNGTTLFALGLIAAVFSIAGNVLGSRLYIARGANIARPVILVVIVVFMVKLIADMFF